MFFAPNLKRKKGGSNKLLLHPFPKVESGKQYEGVFTGIFVKVSTKEDIVAIYDNGFYGKGSQSRSMPQVVLQNCISKATPENECSVEETLCLGLEEAFFLSFCLNVLKIRDMEGTEIELERFIKESLEVNEQFVETLASYLYLKSKGWVVKSGLKFGGHFLIYRRGPRFYHASFVVIINTPSDTQHLTCINLKGLQRIAETSDKDVLFLEVHKPNNFKLLKLDDICHIQISEVIIRRFNCSSYVQNQRLKK